MSQNINDILLGRNGHVERGALGESLGQGFLGHCAGGDLEYRLAGEQQPNSDTTYVGGRSRHSDRCTDAP